MIGNLNKHGYLTWCVKLNFSRQIHLTSKHGYGFWWRACYYLQVVGTALQLLGTLWKILGWGTHSYRMMRSSVDFGLLVLQFFEASIQATWPTLSSMNHEWITSKLIAWAVQCVYWEYMWPTYLLTINYVNLDGCTLRSGHSVGAAGWKFWPGLAFGRQL